MANLNPQDMKPMTSLEVKAVDAEVKRQYGEADKAGELNSLKINGKMAPDEHAKIEDNIRGTITGSTKEGIMSVSFEENVKVVTAKHAQELVQAGPQKTVDHSHDQPVALAQAAGVEKTTHAVGR